MAISKQQPMREAEIAFINALDNGDFVERDELETIKQELESDVDIKIEKILPIETNNIEDEAITSSKISKLAVNSDNLNLQSVSTAQLKDSAVTTAKIGNVAVTNAKLATNAVNTINIIDGAVTDTKINANTISFAKLSNVCVDSIFSNLKYRMNNGLFRVPLGGVDEYAITNLNLANNTITQSKLAEDLSTLIDFLKTIPNMQFDYSPESYTIPANSTETVTITFASELTTTPSVFVDTQANVNSMIYSSVKSVTTTGFDVILKNDSDSEVSNITFDYLVLSAR